MMARRRPPTALFQVLRRGPSRQMVGFEVLRMTGQRPLVKFRAGQVSCAIWENEITVGDTQKTVLKASVERRFKDKNGEWRSSQSFGRNEIPLAIYCLGKAFDKIIREETSGNNGAVEVEEVF